MKKNLIMLILCFLAVAVKAQSTGDHIALPRTLVMPDGSVVPTQRMDSIKKVFGGRDVTISFSEDGKAYAHPAQTKTERLESETKLNLHLNQPAPKFAFKDMSGKLYSLDDLKGKTVVLNFWFTSCGGCIMEMPDLNKLKRNFARKNVIFLAVTYDDEVKINKFLTKHQFDYTIIPNARKMCTDYNVYGYPTSMVIDRNGIIKYINCSIDSDIQNELTKSINAVI
jgi:peroxiredoxin